MPGGTIPRAEITGSHRVYMQSVSALVTEQFSTVVMTIKLPPIIYELHFLLVFINM